MSPCSRGWTRSMTSRCSGSASAWSASTSIRPLSPLGGSHRSRCPARCRPTASGCRPGRWARGSGSCRCRWALRSPPWTGCATSTCPRRCLAAVSSGSGRSRRSTAMSCLLPASPARTANPASASRSPRLRTATASRSPMRSATWCPRSRACWVPTVRSQSSSTRRPTSSSPSTTSPPKVCSGWPSPCW